MGQAPPTTRTAIIGSAKTIVVKVGTNVLSKADDTLDLDRIESLCDQVLRILDSGRKVVMVSSGAIGAGMSLLGLKHRPKDLPHLQAAAAVGQAHLIRLYNDCLQRRGYSAAQLLLTANDFKNRTRYLNVRNTLNTLFEYRVVPIINENDTVSIAEIKFGDNDQLAAMVTGLMDSPLLVILSVVSGLFDGDPAKSDSKLIPLVASWDDAASHAGCRIEKHTRDWWDAIEARSSSHRNRRRRGRHHRGRHATEGAR